MVLHIQPVPDIFSFAVYRKWFIREDIVDQERNKFFRKMIRAVVIGTPADKRGQTKTIVKGCNKVIAARFCCRIR
jgi:hypothetical protein